MNDAGIITLPDGRHVIVVVFITNSTADIEAQERIMALLADAVWRSWTHTLNTGEADPPGLQRRKFQGS